MFLNKLFAILTYHRVINYGGILQTYALQKTIQNFGVNCVILDYRNPRLEKLHRKRTLKECKNIADYIRYFFLNRNYNKKFDKFRIFSEKYLTMSKPYFNNTELLKDEHEFDKFIVGSDQVWNYKINDMDTTYLLSFVKDEYKKLTYAASFGVTSIPDNSKDIYCKFLNDFENILVREKQGADLIKQLVNKDAKIVLDPTLLVTKEEWSYLCKEQNSMQRKYILVYAFGGSSVLMDLAKNISLKTGYRIVRIEFGHKLSIGIKYIKSAGPEEFLELIKNAEYVITNSFHGTAFSINFNKQFSVEMLSDKSGVNSRLEDILDIFDLKDRVITTSQPNIIENKINYEKVNIILERERLNSLALLKSAINSDLTKENVTSEIK